MSYAASLVRLTRHPQDPAVVLAHTPPEWAERMGRFQPARYASEHRAYLVHRELLGSFEKFVRIEGGRIVDERGGGPSLSASRHSGPECSSCGQPASASARLKVCPACGKPWQAIVHTEAAIGATRHPCPSCGHRQGGRFPHCARCGSAMHYPDPSVRRPAVEVRRVHLEEPQPLAEAVEEFAPTPPAGVDPATGEILEEEDPS